MDQASVEQMDYAAAVTATQADAQCECLLVRLDPFATYGSVSDFSSPHACGATAVGGGPILTRRAPRSQM